MKNNSQKIWSLNFALMLILSTFAFAFLIGSEVTNVSAVGAPGTDHQSGTLVPAPTDKGGATTPAAIPTVQGAQVSSATLTKTVSLQAPDGTTVSSNQVFNSNGQNYITNGKVNVEVPSNYQIGGENLLINNAIDPKFITSTSTTPVYYYGPLPPSPLPSTNSNGITSYRVTTLSNGDSVTQYSTNGQDWLTASPDQLTEQGITVKGTTISGSSAKINPDDGSITSPGIVKPTTLYNNQGVIVQQVGNQYFSSTQGQLAAPSSAGTDAKPTAFDASGVPTQWTATSGAMYDNNNQFIGRGTEKTVFSDTTSFGYAQLWTGFVWAAAAGGIIMTLGSLLSPNHPKQVQALAAAASVGILAGKAAYALLGNGGANLGSTTNNQGISTYLGFGDYGGLVSGAIGVAAAWLTYNAMWSKQTTDTQIVNFNCLPWQAPHGGSDCELCNDNVLPCSEYRCRSLGQSCNIVNVGTTSERCVDVNPRDVAPPVITPLASALTEGYLYFDVRDMPPGAGFKIKSKSTSTGCIPPFTPITFGIQTNEPAQCKIDLQPQGGYANMSTYFGGTDLYSYNHTEYLSLPAAKDFQNSSITLANGKELSFYIRCQDAIGNSNEADYQMTLCVDPSPDTTPPEIQGTSITNGGCVPTNTDNASVNFYVNEPAECRWDFKDMDFKSMKYNMSCQTSSTQMNALQVYPCNALLTGISKDTTNYYVRCKDQPQLALTNDSARNTDMQSYAFSLVGSNALKMSPIMPNDTVYGSIRPAPVTLSVQTTGGCDNNQATCFYSTTNVDKSFVQFFDTDTADGVSTQDLNLDDGTYNYFVKCVDSGGNVASSSTSFDMSIDTNAPLIARIYQEDTYLKVVTPQISECVYTNDNCDYNFNEGAQMTPANSTTHIADWSSDKTYYIKCRDQYHTEPLDCSTIVRPTDNFL